MAPELQSLIAAALGGSGVGVIVRFFLKRALVELDKIPEKINKIDVQLAKMQTQLEDVPACKKSVRRLDRDVAVLKATTRGHLENNDTYVP